MDVTDQLHYRLVLENCKLEHSGNPLQLVTVNAPKRHTARHIWRLMLWACGLSAGVVLLFIETVSGVAVLPIVAIVGILAFSAFGIRLMQKSESASRIVLPIPKSSSKSSGIYAGRVNFDCFTKEEKVSWLRNEPNFTKRIVTPLDVATSKRRDYGRIFQSFVSRTSVGIRDRLNELLSALTV